MDKFTVDLEKVLDEFEYSEGREEAVPPSSNQSFLRNSSKCGRGGGAAAPYRRPPFQPVSLADADFSAEPSSLRQQVINLSKHSNSTPPPPLDPAPILPVPSSNKPTDEKPDLLDSNCLKLSESSDDVESLPDKACLPDITSVSSYSEPREENLAVQQLDLIKRSPATEQDSDSSPDLPPIVAIETIEADLPHLQVAPLTFDSVDIPDSDLVSYLDGLDLESSAINSICDNISEVVRDKEPIDKNSEPEKVIVEATVTDTPVVNVKIDTENQDPAPIQQVDSASTQVTTCVSDVEETVITLKENDVNTEDPTTVEDKDKDCDTSSLSLADNDSTPLSISSQLDTKQKYSICPDISDQDEPDEPLTDPVSNSEAESCYTRSDVDNGNAPSYSDGCTPLSVGLSDSDSDSSSSRVENSNSKVEDQQLEIKEDVSNSICVQENNPPVDKIIIRVAGPETNNNETVTTEVSSVNGNESSVSNVPFNDNIDKTTDTTVADDNLSFSKDGIGFASLNCLPAESCGGFAVDNVSGKEDETVGSSGTEDTGVRPEEIDNRDNEEKLVQGLDTPDLPHLIYPPDPAHADLADQDSDQRPPRPTTLPLPPHHMLTTDSEESPTPSNSTSPSGGGGMSGEVGRRPPYWVPDTESDSCLLCSARFTVIKRRHHCRACGLVLCSKCCNLKAPLEYMGFAEARVCQPCFNIIYRVGLEEGRYNEGRQPNPNNPMEYCSTVPPLQQVSSSCPAPPAVFVPTSVLKREGRGRSETPKQVMFSDGIRPGGDLTELDGSGSTPRLLPRRPHQRKQHSANKGYRGNSNCSLDQSERRALEPSTQSFIPANGDLPPMVTVSHGNITFLPEQLTTVGSEPVKFAINYNLFISVKRIKLSCCVNREVWSVRSEGLCLVGQDEVAVVLETLPGETLPHVDVFHLVNYLWKQAALGNTASEMCFTAWFNNSLLGSNDHSGFLYIRPSLQCTTNLLLPSQPYLVALLVHRWETGWARLLPLRLVLRLGAEYRYYPCPLVSVRNRPPLYTHVGHTIIKILADFRKFSYSLATVRGMVIHFEDKQTTILFPKNRYDQVMRALNNSNESVLAFGANLSLEADSHLVCIQGAKDENTYHTEAINIHNKPRKVTGASFVVFNGALKGSGESGRRSIVEDGLMVQLSAERMGALRSALRSLHDFSLPCGPSHDQTVLVHWTQDDTRFNTGVRSCIDGHPLDGVPSIRVHNGTDYTAHCRLIRWTEVFILQCEEGVGEPLDVSRVSESIARATCSALLPLLDSLAQADLNPLAIRATIHQDNVGYDAGSRGERLGSEYMKRLDDELVPVLHQAAPHPTHTPVVLELLFRLMLLP